MQRLVAGLAVFAFLAACSDSSTTAPRQLHPATALDASDPPPPPLSGAGSGFAFAGSDDAAINASSVTGAPPLPSTLCDHGFPLTYTFKYLVNNTGSNEMAHLDLTGATTGQVTMHDLGNGKTDAKGRIQDGIWAFDITDGVGTIDAVVAAGVVGGTFSYSVTGMLTNLVTGGKCTTTGFLSGGFAGVD